MQAYKNIITEEKNEHIKKEYQTRIREEKSKKNRNEYINKTYKYSKINSHEEKYC